MVNQIVLDRKGAPNDFSTTYGITVDMLMAKFAENDKLDQALKEAQDAKDRAAQAAAREQELREQVDLKAGNNGPKIQETGSFDRLIIIDPLL